MERLKTEIDLLQSLLAEANGSTEQPTPKRRAARSDVKQIVLSMLETVGTGGLNAAIVSEMADKQGTPVDRQSASSLLSRLKNQGVVVYDGRRYRLAQHENTPQDDSPMRH